MMTIPEEMIIALGWTIVHSIWQFGLVALILKGIVSLIPNSKSTLKYNLFLGALLVSILLFASTFILEWQANTKMVLNNLTETTTPSQPIIQSTSFPVETRTTHAELTPATLLNQANILMDDYALWIVIAWLIGMLLFSIRFMNAYFFLNNLRKIGVEMSEHWQSKVDELKVQLGIDKKIDFLLSHIAEQPMTFGFFKPVILMPFSLVAQLSPEQVETVLLHELSHIKRNDYLVNLFQSLLEIIFFFHPAIWWMSNQIRKIREEVCDDKVIAQGTDPLQYAQSLLKTKKHIFNNSKTRLAMNATNQNSNHFTQRIYRIMGKESQLKSRSPLSKPMMAIAVLLCVFILSACTSLAVSGKKITSVSADKMNVLYIGVDNPITVAVSNTDYKDLKITCKGGGLKVTPTGEGKFIAHVDNPRERAKLIVEGKDFKQEMEFRVKRIPTPVPSLLFTEWQDELQMGGKTTINSFRNARGVVAVIENFDFGAECEIIGYEVTRVPKKQDPYRCSHSGSLYKDSNSRVQDIVNDAETGDTYYFDNIKCQCPGDAAARKISPMVWSIE